MVITVARVIITGDAFSNSQRGLLSKKAKTHRGKSTFPLWQAIVLVAFEYTWVSELERVWWICPGGMASICSVRDFHHRHYSPFPHEMSPNAQRVRFLAATSMIDCYHNPKSTHNYSHFQQLPNKYCLLISWGADYKLCIGCGVSIVPPLYHAPDAGVRVKRLSC